MSEDKKATDPKPSAAPWASELPKYLTGAGGLIAAIAALLTALNGIGVFRGRATPIPPPQPTATAAVANTQVAPSATHAQPVTVQHTATPVGLLLVDDFADPTSGWLTDVTPVADKGYADGAYRIAIFQREQASWSHPLQVHDWADMVVEVDARLLEAAGENQYGVLVRYDRDAENFYLFSINSDGQYMVEKRYDDEWITMVQLTDSPAVRKGTVVNHLRVECQSATMRFYANGELLVKVDDAALPSGDIGLLAAALGEPTVSASFDNIVVRALY